MSSFALLFLLSAVSAPAPTALPRATIRAQGRDPIADGFFAYRHGDWTACTAAFGRAIGRGEPDEVLLASNVHTTLGACYDELGRPAEALRHHRRAIALEAKNAIAWANLGVSRRMAGRFDEAEDAYERALALDPDNAIVHANLGAVLVLRGDPQ